MSTAHHFRSQRAADAVTRTPWWLWLSVPIALLGIPASVAGIFVDRVYANETANWQAQAIGQDVSNLVVIPVLLVLGYAAARGSARALLAWAGTVMYVAYSYVLYAFAVHFGPLFLLYVAVLGLSAWALIGFFAGIDPARVSPASRPGRLTGFTSTLLILLASAFAMLWLSQDLPAMLSSTPPDELRDTGLLTNPVHVIDLALFLPAALVAGVLLRRGRPWGQILAPVVLSAMAGISLGIVCLTIVTASRGEHASPVVAAVLGLLGILQALTCRRFLKAMDPGILTRQPLHEQDELR
ncbi:hypothetical protein EV138_1419 [Kribbella voronezhensis]|uniref:Uncharacterized protein n=1 Tax=Kribbella voronezhensis TaxID=2512212 RepID=A0A4V3FJX0_9ACTN|nr:hypothetical protein [Kribbella voronezhensis]TDU87883.1 hypothetical protein EV138_1419 [Kribbella voronezhensis]